MEKDGTASSFEYIKHRDEIVMQRSSDIKGRIKGRQLDGRQKDQKKTSRVVRSQVTTSCLFSGLRG